MWICKSCQWVNKETMACKNCRKREGSEPENVSVIVDSLGLSSGNHGQYHRPNKPLPNVQTHADGTAWG